MLNQNKTAKVVNNSNCKGNTDQFSDAKLTRQFLNLLHRNYAQLFDKLSELPESGEIQNIVANCVEITDNIEALTETLNA